MPRCPKGEKRRVNPFEAPSQWRKPKLCCRNPNCCGRCSMSDTSRLVRYRTNKCGRLGYSRSLIIYTARRTMPDIMIRCPVRGVPVPTGLTTEQIIFESLAGITMPLHCPACLKTHQWEQKQAWIAKEA
jgi:hypothetical protein